MQLVICGMHRSGTSLTASVLQKSGLDIGRDIYAPGISNRHGHFEDQDFFRLHEDVLALAGESPFTVGHGFVPPESADFERRARALAAAREALPLWGWKDPRTCLFLELWNLILPEARYLFLYRHPVDVALSLWRRNSDLELRQDPWLAVRAWEVYNRRLLEFHRLHAERIFLAQVPALTADFGELVRRLRLELGVPLHDCDPTSVFASEDLTTPTFRNPEWEELISGALALYRQLEERADLPSREANPLTARPPARERELLRASETLLYVLLEKVRPGAPTPPLVLRRQHVHRRGLEEKIVSLETELAKDRARIRELEATLTAERRQGTELRAALQGAEAHCGAIAQVLAEIDGSLSFAPVRAWWWLRRRLRRLTRRKDQSALAV